MKPAKFAFRIIFCVVLSVASLISGCSVTSDKAVKAPPSTSQSGGTLVSNSNGATANDSGSAEMDVLHDAVLGAELSYFDSKFGTGVKKDSDLTIGYMDGKIRVTENQGYAFNVFNSYVDRGEAASPEEALAFIKQFLPKDAVLVKDEENKETKIHTYTYTSKALKAQTGLAGQLNIDIYKDPSNDTKVRQAQISIDITANL